MSDFVMKPLNKRMNQGNPISRIEKVERAVGPGPSASVESLSDLSTESGIIRGDLILSPASGVETEEVTSTDYTGVFMAGDGKTFNSEDWNFGGVSAGILQFGVSALTGKAYAGGGVVVLDADGVTINTGTSKTDPNTIKFYGTSISKIAGELYATATLGGGDDQTFVYLNSGGSAVEDARLYLQAIGDGGTASIALTSTTAGLRFIELTGGATVLEGFLGIGPPVDYTVASGAITVTGSNARVTTEAAAATDDLDTINGGSDGDLLFIQSANSNRDVTLKDGTGNLRLAGDFTLGTANTTHILLKNYLASVWIEVSRSNN